MKFIRIRHILCLLLWAIGTHAIHAQTNIKSDSGTLLGTQRAEIAQPMQTFMNSFNGTRASIARALNTLKENDDVDTENIENKDLGTPLIDDHVLENGYDVYVIRASDSNYTYTYQVYWKAGKIHKIHQLAYRAKSY